MNWFTRYFSKNESVGFSDAQLQSLTIKLSDQARFNAINSVREQFSVVHKTLENLLKENSDLRQSVVDLSSGMRSLKTDFEELYKKVELSTRKINEVHGSIGEDRKQIASALVTMNGRINDVMPATRARDAAAMLSTLGKDPEKNAAKKDALHRPR